ncbi:Mur ligase family protein [Tundrisphaera lichenicola]|uniref:Mur ligase family protein n=1 Tax=Tundrisphaera lichenicola TaxID=2029860 RepID=UPI003EC0DE56
MTRWFLDRSPQRGIPSVSLRRLLPDARFVGCHDWEVSGCTADTRKLNPGQLFVAVRGGRVDGHTFVARALEHGAAGVVVERACPEAGRLQVVVPDSRSAYARISHALAGGPASSLQVAGVTGRRGKSATALFLRSILRESGESVGSIGRSDWSDGTSDRPRGPDSPGPEGFASMLSAMVERGCDSAVLELDDRTIDRREIAGFAFQSAVITGLGGPSTRIEGADREALLARRRSFARLARLVEPGGSVVINADEPESDVLGAVNLEARRVTFGRERAAQVSAKLDRLDASGSTLRLRGFDREAVVTLRLAGEEHVGHALAAAAVAWSRGIDLRAVVDGLEAVTRLPGRLEPVLEGQEFEVRIDRARSAPDLARALASLRGLGASRLICVVGAEGGRDRLRRAALGRAAELGADRVILTTDNPRAEDPDQILDDLLAGLRHPGRAIVEPDRRAAIAQALADALPGDAVLIAGKGHHTYQILNDRVLPFNDAEVAAHWLRARRTATRSISA